MPLSLCEVQSRLDVTKGKKERNGGNKHIMADNKMF
jgi:hypothetical protein